MSPAKRLPVSAVQRQSAQVFSALGDEARLRLVDRICDRGPASIAELTEGSGVTRQAVTKHLRVLADAGLVTGEKHGRETRWRLLPGGLDTVRSSLERIDEQWGAALQRLRSYLEDEDS